MFVSKCMGRALTGISWNNLEGKKPLEKEKVRIGCTLLYNPHSSLPHNYVLEDSRSWQKLAQCQELHPSQC